MLPLFSRSGTLVRPTSQALCDFQVRCDLGAQIGSFPIWCRPWKMFKKFLSGLMVAGVRAVGTPSSKVDLGGWEGVCGLQG